MNWYFYHVQTPSSSEFQLSTLDREQFADLLSDLGVTALVTAIELDGQMSEADEFDAVKRLTDAVLAKCGAHLYRLQGTSVDEFVVSMLDFENFYANIFKFESRDLTVISEVRLDDGKFEDTLEENDGVEIVVADYLSGKSVVETSFDDTWQ